MWRFIGVAFLVLVTACSDTKTTATQQSTDFSSLVERVASNCTDAPVPRLGQGNFCIDSGFTFSKDDFSFANWGISQKADENITIQTLIDLFGHNSVCLNGNEATCTVRPITTQKLIEWNSALAGGRCRGDWHGSRLHRIGAGRSGDGAGRVQQPRDPGQDRRIRRLQRHSSGVRFAQSIARVQA